MRVLQLGKYYPPHQGGMETVLANLAEGLLEQGVQVRTLVAGTDTTDRWELISSGPGLPSLPLTRMASAGQLHSQPLTLTMLSHLRRELDLFQPDLVHLHLPNPLAVLAWSAVLVGRSRPHPLLAIWHHADITRQKLGGRILKPLLRHCYRKAAGICVSSEPLANSSPLLQPLASRVEVIPFGIAPEPWLSLESKQEGEFLFVGRLVPYKGLTTLLEALKAVPEANLSIVGDGPLRPLLEEVVAREGLQARVTWCGACPRKRLLELLNTARALILPSVDNSETFGLVQLEAMAAAVPVIASDLDSGVAQVGVPGETCLLVPAGQPRPLAEAMTRLARNPDLGKKLGIAARLRFQELYTRQIMSRRITAWYQELMRKGWN